MAISGDYRVDALLRGADARWNAGLPYGTQTVVSYAFSNALPSQYQGLPDVVITGGGSYTYVSLDEAHRAIARSEFAILAAAVPGLQFFETSNPDAAVITISAYAPGPDTLGNSDANGYSPGGADTSGNLRASGDLWFRSTSTKYDLTTTWNGIPVQPTQFADMVLHEIGHAIGFKHPGNYNPGSGSDGPPYLPAGEDDSLNTVMSYMGDFAGPNPRPYDLLAGTFLYGPSAPASGLWLLANDGNAAVQGSSLNELIVARSASEQIDGAAGLDVVRYGGARSAYTLSKTASGYSLADSSAGTTDTLSNIERLAFADKSVALDLTPTGSAGKTVEMIGAAFGLAALSNQGYVGIGLGLFDQGQTMEQIAQLCIGTGLVSAAPDNDSFVRAVWLNVIGSPIDQGNLNNFKSMLDSGMSQAALLTMAAEHALNQQHVNLVGLASTGIEYV